MNYCGEEVILRKRKGVRGLANKLHIHILNIELSQFPHVFNRNVN
jgi:hypothetical protein